MVTRVKGSTLFDLIENAAADQGAVATRVLKLLQDGNSKEFVLCATQIEKAYPILKEDGVDKNGPVRNNRLSILRAQIRRASAELSRSPMTVLRDGAGWKFAEATARPRGSTQTPETRLKAAVELVVANLEKPEVLAAIQTGLRELATRTAEAMPLAKAA